MQIEVRDGGAASLFSFLRVTLALLGPLWFHTDVNIIFVSVKYVNEMLVVIARMCTLLWLEWRF